MTGRDRRRHLRVVVAGAFGELMFQGATLGPVTIEDVSEGGVFAGSPSPSVPVGTEVELVLDETGTREVFRGKIAQIVRPGDGQPTGYGISLVEEEGRDVVKAVERSRSSPNIPMPDVDLLAAAKAAAKKREESGKVDFGDLFVDQPPVDARPSADEIDRTEPLVRAPQTLPPMASELKTKSSKPTTPEAKPPVAASQPKPPPPQADPPQAAAPKKEAPKKDPPKKDPPKRVAVHSAPKIDPPKRKPAKKDEPQPAAAAVESDNGPTKAVICLADRGRAAAMGIALEAFGVATLVCHSSELAMTLVAIEAAKKSIRVMLVEMASVGELSPVSLGGLQAAAPKARVVLSSPALPTTEERAMLQGQGADRLFLEPYDPFEALSKLYAIVTPRRR